MSPEGDGPQAVAKAHKLRIWIAHFIGGMPNAPQQRPRATGVECEQGGLAGSAGCGLLGAFADFVETLWLSVE
jgi:hypothetical protein